MNSIQPRFSLQPKILGTGLSGNELGISSEDKIEKIKPHGILKT